MTQRRTQVKLCGQRKRLCFAGMDAWVPKLSSPVAESTGVLVRSATSLPHYALSPEFQIKLFQARGNFILTAVERDQQRYTVSRAGCVTRTGLGPPTQPGRSIMRRVILIAYVYALARDPHVSPPAGRVRSRSHKIVVSSWASGRLR